VRKKSEAEMGKYLNWKGSNKMSDEVVATGEIVPAEVKAEVKVDEKKLLFQEVRDLARQGQRFRRSSWPADAFWYKSDPNGCFHGCVVNEKSQVISDPSSDDRYAENWELVR
jgi:hypothetical protein